MTNLFTPFTYKGLELKNRIVMPPMCQYSVPAKDGVPTDWHVLHYASRAVGGTGLVIMEMTDVDPDGRITDFDLGIWSDEHVPAFRRVVDAVHAQGAKIGIQIAHAGRKATDAVPPVAPSAIAFNEESRTPRELTTEEVQEMVEKFRLGVRRAVQAGVDVVEIHAAHGYLIHQFHSPLTNQRTDVYGQDPARFGAEVIQAAKEELPADMPLIVRISAVEYVENGYGLDYSIELCKRYQQAGADIFHVTSGGEGPIGSNGRPGVHAGYQVPMARAVKEALGCPVIAVGRLDNPVLADAVLGNGEADLVAVGRGMLHDPYWALHAAEELKMKVDIPQQYVRGF
ncbi:NADH:flavin oxidoreductase/NADH oxidase [Ectobacillus ponti]|uniref:NADH:flavin oxidoreductase/NADH oxidase n=1 Tax=Ectobacillus ponti TaxID=2961894 RepID=A0AA41X447_9BACI|nr:NADH:flavin oxidoreductase/NADH oxidase [Ectobacillus ponti]MCP8968586.1 NADH:flavin oxidoreductase/NADH oxidase [Ectobacillus ponti]